jgi:hypothetical protein
MQFVLKMTTAYTATLCQERGEGGRGEGRPRKTKRKQPATIFYFNMIFALLLDFREVCASIGSKLHM